MLGPEEINRGSCQQSGRRAWDRLRDAETPRALGSRWRDLTGVGGLVTLRDLSELGADRSSQASPRRVCVTP